MTSPITKLEITDDITLFTVENIPNCVRTVAGFFTDIEREGISLDMISRAPSSRETGNISFTVSDGDFAKVAAIANKLKTQITDLIIKADTGNTKINLYGEPMSERPGVAAGVFRALSALEGLKIKMITTSEVDISILLSQEDADAAAVAIKREFKI
ncbi:MAG: ACT domain-containing protein [Clostridia bacterium]|nr:ACT domain-containing protein [Clostridia bacterium]